MPVTLVKSSWSSGDLIFHESAHPSTTYDVLKVGTSAVMIGNTANDIDFQFYGTGSISAIIDCGAKTFSTVGLAHNINTTGSPLTYVAGTPGVAWFFTAAGSGTTNCEPFVVTSVVTGTSPVGGRAKFVTTCNVTAGGWINALKSHFQFGTSGKVTGLASSMCVEMDLPNANLGSGGAYYPLEVELNPGASTVSAGSATGNRVGFMFMSVNTNKADFDTNGFLFEVQGLTADTGKLLAASTTESNYAYSLRVNIGGTPMYLMLASAAG